MYAMLRQNLLRMLSRPLSFRFEISKMTNYRNWNANLELLNSIPERTKEKGRILIGPANYATQALEFSNAINERLGMDVAESVNLDSFKREAHHNLSVSSWELTDGIDHLIDYLAGASHIILDGGLGLWGGRGWYFGNVCDILKAKGYDVAYLAHGSDVRQPSININRQSGSPYEESGWRQALSHESISASNRRYLRSSKVPIFYVTLDLADYLPSRSVWTPTVIGALQSQGGSFTPQNEKEIGRPKVLFGPSQGWWKGARVVDEVMFRLRDEGLIEYVRFGDTSNIDGGKVALLNHAEFLSQMDSCDILIDQIKFEGYGVTSLEGLIRGKIVASRLGQYVKHLEFDVPIIYIDESNIEVVFRQILENFPSLAVEKSLAGPVFVKEFHSGLKTADAILKWYYS